MVSDGLCGMIRGDSLGTAVRNISSLPCPQTTSKAYALQALGCPKDKVPNSSGFYTILPKQAMDTTMTSCAGMKQTTAVVLHNERTKRHKRGLCYGYVVSVVATVGEQSKCLTPQVVQVEVEQRLLLGWKAHHLRDT